MKRRAALVVSLALASFALTTPAHATRTLEEFRYFRALSIDLNGRIPTRDEVATFSRDDFDVEAWVTAHLQGPRYAERMRRIYSDLLRLELSDAFTFNPTSVNMRRIRVNGPDGPEWVYFRQGQRRNRIETDGAFCFTPAESGVQLPGNGLPVPGCDVPRTIPRADWDSNTVAVRPWWLYRDYRSATPTQAYAPDWATTIPGFAPTADLLTPPPGGTPFGALPTIRVCREEASVAPAAALFAPAARPRPTGTSCNNQLINAPANTAYARAHVGEMVSCETSLGFSATAGCGCGVGLERCMPASANSVASRAFYLPSRTPLGFDLPLDRATTTQPGWLRYWWAQEAVHFLDDIFETDRDIREVLTGRQSFVNGPLVQFYDSIVPTTCCGNNALAFNYLRQVPLFDPATLPRALLPHDATRWSAVANRGPLASGILTMPVFLTKYGTRRGRAHVLWNAFMCRDFTAPAIPLPPSDEVNLMTRPGCRTCHETLEPLAAYFAQVQESTWQVLPAANFPVLNPACSSANAASRPDCRIYYDPDFATATNGMLRGAYGSPANAALGPAGIGRYLTAQPGFAPCVAENVASSFLGRQLNSEDAVLKQQLTAVLQRGGFRPREMVRALVLSEAYRYSNNVASNLLRDGGTR